jgi:hypothetical protein
MTANLLTEIGPDQKRETIAVNRVSCVVVFPVSGPPLARILI